MSTIDQAQRDALSDSDFAFPRVRKEPLTDAKHVRAAVSRFRQVTDVNDDERDQAWARIRRAATEHGVELSESDWRRLS